jgi:hypothetical protein
MVKRTRPFLASLVALSLLGWVPAAADATAVPTGADAGSDTLSVGDFLLRYAQAMKLPLGEGVGPEEAVAEMKAQGLVEESVDPSLTLTEGDVVRFASRVGLRLTTLNEDRVFPASKVDSFFDSFGGSFDVPGSYNAGIGATGGGDNDRDDRERRKRKKKKDFESPVDEDDDDDDGHGGHGGGGNDDDDDGGSHGGHGGDDDDDGWRD